MGGIKIIETSGGTGRLAEGHTSSEYAEKQRKRTLNSISKVDVSGFIQENAKQKCIVEIKQNGATENKLELDHNDVYTIWYDNFGNRWCYSNAIVKGVLDEANWRMP